MIAKPFRIAIATLFLAVPAFFAGGVNAQSLDDMTDEERTAFRQYQFYDNIFQQEPFMEAEVGEYEFSQENGSFRTTNPNPTSDDSIGAIYYYSFGTGKYEAICTASHLGGKWWLTAEHCIRGDENSIGAIVQTDGDFAGIENVYFKDRDHDIALVKVGTGISTPKAFSLAETAPSIGREMEVIGFSGHGDLQHDFSSKSKVKIVSGADSWKNSKGDFEYYDISHAEAIDYPTCSGDSGGPMYVGRAIFGVTSGVRTPLEKTFFYECRHHGYYANVNAHIPWIRETMRSNNSTSLGEQIHAFRGGVAVKYNRGCDINKKLRNPAFSSSSSSSESSSKCERKLPK